MSPSQADDFLQSLQYGAHDGPQLESVQDSRIMIFCRVLKHKPFDRQMLSGTQHELWSAVGSHGVLVSSRVPSGKKQAVDSQEEKS